MRAKQKPMSMQEYMTGVEGFKTCGTGKKLELKLPQRNEEHMLAWDIYTHDNAI